MKVLSDFFYIKIITGEHERAHLTSKDSWNLLSDFKAFHVLFFTTWLPDSAISVIIAKIGESDIEIPFLICSNSQYNFGLLQPTIIFRWFYSANQ